MFRVVFEIIYEKQSEITPSLRFEKRTDFLRVSEFEFLVRGSDDKHLAPIVDRFLLRRVPKRAFILDFATIKRAGGNTDDLRKLHSLPERKDFAHYSAEIRSEIANGVPKRFGVASKDVWLDLPTNPPLSDDAEQCMVDLDPGQDPVSLRSLFPSDEWVAAYGDNKWAGHVFYGGSEDARRAVGASAKEVLEAVFGIKLDDSGIGRCFKE